MHTSHVPSTPRRAHVPAQRTTRPLTHVVARLPRQDGALDVIVGRFAWRSDQAFAQDLACIAASLAGEERPWTVRVAIAWGIQPGAHERTALDEKLDGPAYQAIFDAGLALQPAVAIKTLHFAWTGLTWGAFLEIDPNGGPAGAVARRLVPMILAALPELGVVAIGLHVPQSPDLTHPEKP